MWRKIRDAGRDAVDIARRARSAGEVAKALVPSLREPRVLNEGSAPARPASELIAELRGARNALKGSIVDGRVDYDRLRETDAFAGLEAAAPALAHLRPEDLSSDAERTAFFINLYNVLAMHGVVALGIRESVMEIPSFFSVVSYRVGGEVVNLDQIENGVLRRNAGHPATGRATLPAGSPTLAFCPSAVDPRIHAALVCASTSCPPVGFYDPARLDTQLDLAARSYVAADVRVGRAVHLPITFRYYAADWGGRPGIERFLLAHAEPDHAEALRRAFARGATFAYDRYDWSLNVL